MRRKSNDRKDFEDQDNPFNLSWRTVKERMKTGKTLKEAMSYPAQNQNSEDLLKFESHPNPYNLKWSTIRSRIRMGQTFEEAMSYPLYRNEKYLSQNKIDFEKHDNPYNLKWSTVLSRIKSGKTLEEAMSYPFKRYNKSSNGIESLELYDNKDRIDFENHPNPFNLNWKTVQYRIEKGETLDEAMSHPVKKKSNLKEDKKAFENHPNPYNLKWDTITERMREKGETLEKAMSYPSQNFKSKELIAFENHENPFNLEWETVRDRLRRKNEILDEAMSYPCGQYPIDIYKNGFVMYEGKWTSVNDLEMIYDKDTTENMFKTKVKAEKLFKRKG